MACDPVGCLGHAPSAPTEPGSFGCCCPILPQMCRQVSDWSPSLALWVRLSPEVWVGDGGWTTSEEWAFPGRICEPSWGLSPFQKLNSSVGDMIPANANCFTPMPGAVDRYIAFKLMWHYHTTVPLSATESHQDNIWFEFFLIMI